MLVAFLFSIRALKLIFFKLRFFFKRYKCTQIKPQIQVLTMEWIRPNQLHVPIKYQQVY